MTLQAREESITTPSTQFTSCEPAYQTSTINAAAKRHEREYCAEFFSTCKRRMLSFFVTRQTLC